MSRLSLKSGKHISCDHTQLATYGARHMQPTPECSSWLFPASVWARMACWRAISHRNRCVCMFYIMRGNNLAVCRGITPCCPERQWQTILCLFPGNGAKSACVYKPGHLISLLQIENVACCPIQCYLHECTDNVLSAIIFVSFISDFIWIQFLSA